MALDPGDVGAGGGLAAPIYNALKSHVARIQPSGSTPVAPADVETSLKEMAFDIAKGITDHLLSNLEITGVKIALDPGVRLVETFAVGVGTNGGALSTALGPVIGAVNDSLKDTGLQTNDGTGLIK